MAYQLSISGKNIEPDCFNVATILAAMKVVCHITPNISIEPGGVIENGCQILLIFDPVFDINVKEKIKYIWYNLKEKLSLKCAHLTLPNYSNNCCINEYLEVII